MENSNWKCNHCGHNEYVIGKQIQYAELCVKMKGTTLKHEVCLKCGTVNRSYIENPEKFIKYKEQ